MHILTFLVLKTFFIVKKKKTLTTPHLFFELKKNYFIKWRGEPSKFLFLFAFFFRDWVLQTFFLQSQVFLE
jgi:hypothetical protein